MSKIHNINLPDSVVKDLKEGYSYELSWDYATDQISLILSHHYPIEEQMEADKILFPKKKGKLGKV